jgi:hypothetical protein
MIVLPCGHDMASHDRMVFVHPQIKRAIMMKATTFDERAAAPRQASEIRRGVCRKGKAVVRLSYDKDRCPWICGPTGPPD